jgi:hypothetical protein
MLLAVGGVDSRGCPAALSLTIGACRETAAKQAPCDEVQCPICCVGDCKASATVCVSHNDSLVVSACRQTATNRWHTRELTEYAVCMTVKDCQFGL